MLKKTVFFASLMLTGVLSSAVIYLSPEGSDRNPGTDPRKPAKSISQALQRASSGDTIMLRGGLYREQIGAEWKTKNAKPITIKPFPDETPVITWGWDVKNWKKLENGLFTADFKFAVCDLWQRLTLDRYLKVESIELLKKQPGSFYQDTKTGKLYVNPLNDTRLSDPENAGFTAVPFTDGRRPRPFNATTKLLRKSGLNLVGTNLHVEGIALEFHHGKGFYLRGRKMDKFYGSGSFRRVSAVGTTCGLSTGWFVDGVIIEDCLAYRNSGGGLLLGNDIKNVKVINNFLLNNGSNLPFYGNYTAGGGHVQNLGRYGGGDSAYVDLVGNKVISLDKSRQAGVMRFKPGIPKHTNQLNNLFVGGSVTLYSVPGSTATIKNNSVIPGKFYFTVPNTGEKYTPDMKYNLELRDSNWKKRARFVNPEKYDFRLLPDSKHLGKGFAPAAAPVWFVKPGAKGGSGRTPEKPLASLAQLQGKIKSGDTVYFMKGRYTGTLSLKNLKNVTLSDRSFNTALWNKCSLVLENCANIKFENMNVLGGRITLKNSECEFLENNFTGVNFSVSGKKVIFANNRLEKSSIISSGRTVFRENIISALKLSAKNVLSEHNGFMTAAELKKWPFKETFKSFVAGVNGKVPLKNMVRGTRGRWIGSRVVPDRKAPLVVEYAKVQPANCGTKAIVAWCTPKDYVQAYISVFQGKKRIFSDRVRFGDYLSCSDSFCIPRLKPGTSYTVSLTLARHNEDRSWSKSIQFTTAQKGGRRTPVTLEVGAGKKYASVAEAVRNAGNGDTVLVAPGFYPEMIKVFADNVTIKAVRPGTVKFSGEFMFDYVILANNIKGLTIDGIDFVGNRYSAKSKVISITRSEKIRILNCRFFPGRNRRMGNLHIYGRYVKGFEVKNCVFDTGFHSVWLMESGDVLIDHNTFWGIGINAIHVAGGANEKVVITNNLCQDVVANHISPAISVGHPKSRLTCDWNLYWNTRKCPRQKVFGMGGKLGIHSVGQIMRQDALVTIEESRKHYGVEKNGLFADPKMKNPAKGDFTLAANSPARKRGSDGRDIGADMTIWEGK